MTKAEQHPARAASQVEDLTTVLGELLEQREELRAGGADRDMLERNRQQIVKMQWELSRALIARHHRLQPA